MRISDGGFTLIEVLGAVAILAILYTTLATVAIRGLRSEGESRRMLEASLLADWQLSEFELELETVIVFHAGTTWKDQHIVTSGGRVLGLTGVGTDFSSAQSQAYRLAGKIEFPGKHYRTDIAARALRVG